MNRVKRLDVRDPIGWTQVPMLGANLPLELVRLDSSSGTFGLLGRFPAGFSRRQSGGYLCSEEFVVVGGTLEMEGEVLGPGTLGHVPAHFARTSMSSAEGCLVWAWFSGVPAFQPLARLKSRAQAAIVLVNVWNSAAAPLLKTPEAVWSRAAETLPGEGEMDWLTGDLKTWRRGRPTPLATVDVNALVRYESKNA